MTVVINGSTGLSGPNASGDTLVNGVTVGRGAGAVATNTAVGASALAANTTGSRNTAVGYISMVNSGGTVGNTAVGHAAAANSQGNYNTAVGDSALDSTLGGANNTAVGADALQANTTASNNTAVGYQAGYTNQTGTYNLFLGFQAGYTSNVSGTASNTCIGATAGYSLTTGAYNTFIGNAGTTAGSGFYVSSGSKNSILGNYNGNQGGLDIRTASNRIVLSDGDGNPRIYNDGTHTWSVNTSANGQYKAGTPSAWNIFWEFGRDNGTTGNFVFNTEAGAKGYINASTGAYVAVSDIRAKKNIIDSPYGLTEVMQLRAVEYNMVGEEDDVKKHIGFIAQEVKTIIDNAVDDTETEDQLYGLDKSGLVPVLVKAIQEQQSIINAQQAALTALTARVTALEGN